MRVFFSSLFQFVIDDGSNLLRNFLFSFDYQSILIMIDSWSQWDMVYSIPIRMFPLSCTFYAPHNIDEPLISNTAIAVCWKHNVKGRPDHFFQVELDKEFKIKRNNGRGTVSWLSDKKIKIMILKFCEISLNIDVNRTGCMHRAFMISFLHNCPTHFVHEICQIYFFGSTMNLRFRFLHLFYIGVK